MCSHNPQFDLIFTLLYLLVNRVQRIGIGQLIHNRWCSGAQRTCTPPSRAGDSGEVTARLFCKSHSSPLIFPSEQSSATNSTGRGMLGKYYSHLSSEIEAARVNVAEIGSDCLLQCQDKAMWQVALCVL